MLLDALFERLRANYDVTLIDDDLLWLLIGENKGDEVAICRQIEEMTKEAAKPSSDVTARMQQRFKHVIDGPIIALIAEEVNYDENECIAQLTALSACGSMTREETAEQFLQSMFPDRDAELLITCFSEQGQDLGKTIDRLIAMEVIITIFGLCTC